MPSHPYIPFDNTAEAVIMGTNSGDATFITMAFSKVSEYDLTSLNALASLLESWVQSELVPRCGVAQTWDQIKVTDLSTDIAPTVTIGIAPPNVGVHAGDTIPVQVAMVVSLYTANRGRSYRGRNYVPGLTLNQMSDGTHWALSATGAMSDAYANLISVAGAAGFTMVVLSRRNNNIWRVIGVKTPVASAVAKSVVGTQRRRVIGHGI